MQTVVVFGGTGFIGRSLARHLSQHGMTPILVARHSPEANTEFAFRPWDAHTVGPWTEVLEEADAIVNLAGRTVDCIKTPDHCDQILRSRVDATKAIGKALQQCSRMPKVWVQMSTAHIYGDPPSQLCTEDSTKGYGLAPTVGKAWETAFLKALPPEVRGIRLRTSFVVGRNGGALKALSRLVRLGLGGTVGSGTQGMSWIHEWDMNELIRQSIVDHGYRGMYIASAPHPVSNRVFMRSLRKALNMPIGLPAPELLTRIGARLLFKTDPELALYGRYVKSDRLEKQGYAFTFPTLDAALADLTA